MKINSKRKKVYLQVAVDDYNSEAQSTRFKERVQCSCMDVKVGQEVKGQHGTQHRVHNGLQDPRPEDFTLNNNHKVSKKIDKKKKQRKWSENKKFDLH